MNKLVILFTAIAAIGFSAQSVCAQEREIIVERVHHPRVKRVYVIENHRPIRREVFIDERGRYYRVVEGRPVFIERYYESYPTQYFYRDGRVRPGISITF